MSLLGGRVIFGNAAGVAPLATSGDFENPDLKLVPIFTLRTEGAANLCVFDRFSLDPSRFQFATILSLLQPGLSCIDYLNKEDASGCQIHIASSPESGFYTTRELAVESKPHLRRPKEEADFLISCPSTLFC